MGKEITINNSPSVFLPLEIKPIKISLSLLPLPLSPPRRPGTDMSHRPRRLAPLYKQHSWSPDAHREEAWLKRKKSSKRRTKSVTDDDLDELKACIELGFQFLSPEKDQKLSDMLPALDLYYAVNKQFYDSVSKSSNASECDASDVGSPSTSNMFAAAAGTNNMFLLRQQTLL